MAECSELSTTIRARQETTPPHRGSSSNRWCAREGIAEAGCRFAAPPAFGNGVAMAWPWWRWCPRRVEGAAGKGGAGSGSIPKTRLGPVHLAPVMEGNFSPRAVSCSKPLTALARIARLGHLVPSPLSGWLPDPSLPVYCGDRPLEREDNSYLLLPACSCVGEPSASNQTAWTSSRLGAEQIPVAGAARADRRAGRQPLRQGSGLPAAFGEGIPARSWSASCATPA